VSGIFGSRESAQSTRGAQGEMAVEQPIAPPNREADPCPGEHLLLYDGVCGLCNRLVQFVLRRDSDGVFAFASLQSATGRVSLARFGRNADDLDTVYVVARYRTDRPALLSKTDAAIFVMKALGWPWKIAAVLGVLPAALREAGYDIVARNRYRVFGRYESCLLPTAESRRRFIDV
jgi:predicted DCC family thiol-disulfide oxidoreductase YuxK